MASVGGVLPTTIYTVKRRARQTRSPPRTSSGSRVSFVLTYCVQYSNVLNIVVGNAQATIRDNLTLELRRGALVLAVLAQLRHEEYGYSLKKHLADRGLEIDEGTLYPLLRRLEAQGLLKSNWRLEDGRPRRYYRTAPVGERLAAELTAEWQRLTRVVDTLIR